jgi:hypothetical protein
MATWRCTGSRCRSRAPPRWCGPLLRPSPELEARRLGRDDGDREDGMGRAVRASHGRAVGDQSVDHFPHPSTGLPAGRPPRRRRDRLVGQLAAGAVRRACGHRSRTGWHGRRSSRGVQCARAAPGGAGGIPSTEKPGTIQITRRRNTAPLRRRRRRCGAGRSAGPPPQARATSLDGGSITNRTVTEDADPAQPHARYTQRRHLRLTRCRAPGQTRHVSPGRVQTRYPRPSRGRRMAGTGR